MVLKQLGKLGQEIFEQRYAYPGEKTWSDRAKAIAKFNASAEKDEDKENWFNKCYDALGSGDFIPGGRIIFGSGRPNQNLGNCFCKNTKIITSKGIKLITEINIGDEVLTHKGRFRKVVNKFNQGYRKSLFRFKIKGLNRKQNLTVTGDHKIMTPDGYVEASKLNINDRVSLGFWNDEWEINSMDQFLEVSTYVSPEYTIGEDFINEVNQRVIGKKAKMAGEFNHSTGRPIGSWVGVYIPATISIDYNFCLWAGYFLSEGCAPDSGKVVTFTFHKNEINYINEVVILGKCLFGLEASIVPSKQGEWTTVVFNSNILCEFHRNYFGQHSWNKNISKELLSAPIDYLEGLLVGLIRGDGSTYTEGDFKHISLRMANPGLVYQAYLIAKKLGYICSFGYNDIKKKETHRDQGELSIRNYSINNKLLEAINEEVINDFNGRILDIQEIEYNDIVWDISVDEDHSLVADGVIVSNCYVLQPHDNVESIGKIIQDMYKISCGGGGIGFNFSEIRPKGDDIQNIKNSAPGSISVMQMINEIGNHVRAGKNRRTALIAILNVTHPDLLEFLTVKLDKGQLNNFNISVGITQRFIEAVENDEDWYFTFNNKKYNSYLLNKKNPKTDTIPYHIIALNPTDAVHRAEQHYKVNWDDTFEYVEQLQIKAKDIWNRIFKSSVECGDPGLFNIDFSNTYTTANYFEYLPSTNPCGEQVLPSYGNCTLGNVNLAQMVLEDGTDVDWKKLANAVRVGVRFLDNIISLNHYPIQECKEVGQKSRRIGLGVMGLHYMLIRLGIKYGSDKCLEFLGRLFTTIRDEAYLTSVYLAREKGSFPAFDYKQHLATEYAKTLPARVRMLIKQYGIRNAVILNIPPTGTTGMMMEVSTGIEPIFSWAYIRRYRQNNVWKDQVVVDPLFKEFYEAKKDLSNFVGAYEVKPEDHLRVQAEVQKYLDSACSKTINIPKEISWEELSQPVLNYISNLKGVTVYKQNSRGQEPLEYIPLTVDNIKKFVNHEDAIIEVADGAVCNMKGECG